MLKKKLIFVTESYKDNYVFFSSELKKLSLLYDVQFISVSGEEDIDDDTLNYHFYKDQVSKLKKLGYLIKYFLDKRCRREYKRIRKEVSLFSKVFLTRFIKSIEYYASAEEFYKYLKKIIGFDNKNFIYYTYWCNYYTLSMALHKDEYDEVKFISRIHRFDLFDEQFPGGIQPFKPLVNGIIDRILFVSELSRQYYLSVHGDMDVTKAILNRLGTKPLDIRERRKQTRFVLASCSNLLPVKRVHLIVEALSKIDDIEINWIHFGGGPCLPDIERLVASQLNGKNNITYVLFGAVDNSFIREYYCENYIDAFINVSESEGAPVSIMEAMSASIPIIATEVGEASIMCHDNGILLNEKASAQDIALTIRELYNTSVDEKEKMRVNSYNRWLDLFNLDTNIQILIDELIKIGA